MNSVRVRFADIEGTREGLREVAKNLLVECDEVVKVILFGSYAKGTALPSSDADILIVVESSEHERYFDRYGDYIDYFDGISVPVEPFVYTVEEYERMREKFGPPKSADEKGMVLAERG